MSPSLLKTITEKVLNISSIFEYWIDFFYTKLDIKSFNRILQEQIIAERIKHSLPLRQTIITLQQKVKMNEIPRKCKTNDLQEVLQKQNYLNMDVAKREFSQNTQYSVC